MYTNDVLGSEVDMWAFGVLFYFMLNMEYPFCISIFFVILDAHIFSLEKKRLYLLQQAFNFSYQTSVKKSKRKITQNFTPEL